MATLGDLVVRIVGDATSFNKAIDDANKKFTGATSNLAKLGKNLTTFVTLPILGIGAAAIKSAADMEMQQAAFETLLGSAERAKGLLADLTDLAAKTPFQLTDLADASKTMLAFGITAEKILPNIQMLGDIAGGNAEKLKSLTLAFSQIQSTGRLMGQDLLQLINAGFNPLSIIAQKTGKSMADLKKDMERGAISADMVSDAFKTATSEGGLFFGGMERASKTFSGQMSTLLDDIAALGRSFGELLLPVLKNIVGTVSGWVKGFTDLDTETKQAIIQIGLMAATLGPLLLAITKVGQGIVVLKAALTAFSSSSAILLGLQAVVTLAVLIGAGMKKASTEAQNLKDALNGVATIEQQISAIKQQQERAESAARAATAARTEESRKRLEAEAIAEADKLRRLRENLKWEYTTIEAKRIAGEEAARLAQAELDALEKKGKVSAEVANDEIGNTETIITVESDLDRIRRENYESYIKIRAQMAELDRAAAEELVRVWTTAYNTVASVAKPVFESLGAMLANGQVEWKDLASVAVNAIGSIVTAMGDQLAAKAAATLIEAIAALASVVSAPLAPGLFSSAAILSGGATAAWATGGALKAAKFADGGVVQPVPGGIQATVAEAGIAEAIIPLDRLDRMLETASGGAQAGGGMSNLTIKLDSKVLYSGIFDATKNRTVLVSAGAVV